MATDSALLGRWPTHLVNQIVARNFVLIVGAGISIASSNDTGKHPPSWTELIRKLSKELLPTGPRRVVGTLVESGRLIEAAELIRARARETGKEEDFLHLIAELTSGGATEDAKFKPCSLHDSLMVLDASIIVTTNYDKLLERASQDGYNVHSYVSSHLGRDIRSGNPCLVKVHGSVDEVPSLILTRSDYARLRREGSHVLEVLQALFLTRTALFVGYSLSDPDVQLLLENVLGARGQVPAHYLLGPKGMPEYQRDVIKYCYGTSLVPFADGQFAEMARMLQLLGVEVQARRAAGYPGPA